MFELNRLQEAITFNNALLYQATYKASQNNQIEEELIKLLWEKAGNVIREADLVAYHFLLEFERYKGVMPLKAIPKVRPTHVTLMLLLWDIHKGNDFDFEHPLVRIAKQFLKDRTAHFAYQKVIAEAVERLSEVSGQLQLTSLGEFALEEAVRHLATITESSIYFILHASEHSNLPLYGSYTPGFKVAALKTKNATLVMELNE